HPRQDEEPELDPLHTNARVEGCLLVRPDREDRASQGRYVEDDAEDDGEPEEDRNRVRDVRMRDRDDADARESLWEPADRVGRKDPLRDAAVERQRPYRDGERRQAEAGDQEAVERAADPAEAAGRDARPPHRPRVLA